MSFPGRWRGDSLATDLVRQDFEREASEHYKSSSSSCHAASADLPDLLLPSVSIVHRSREVFQATSCIGTELLYIVFSWSTNVCSSVWRGPLEYIAYEFVLTSPGVSCISSSSNLDSFRGRWLVALHLLLYRVLPPGLVQYSSQNSCVIAVNLFLHTFS